ncbi:MAG: hypothetical protein AAGF94_03910 [Pseudomonadota bacterium]
MRHIFKTAFLCLWAAAALGTPARAAVEAYLFEWQGDLVGQFSGSIDTTGLPQANTLMPDALGYVQPDILGFGQYRDGETLTVWGEAGDFGPSNYGTGGPQIDLGPVMGDSFLFNLLVTGPVPGITLVLAQNYMGGMISGRYRLPGRNLNDIGAVAGTYLVTLPSTDTITLNVGARPPVVPLPATLPLLLTTIAAGAALRFRTAQRH